MSYDDLLTDLKETGNLSLSCRTLGVNKSTFLWAVDHDEELADQYMRARSQGYDAVAEIALEEGTTWTGDPALGRLSLDARKWYLSKLAAKKYGDRLDLTTDGEQLAPDLGALAIRAAALMALGSARMIEHRRRELPDYTGEGDDE